MSEGRVDGLLQNEEVSQTKAGEKETNTSEAEKTGLRKHVQGSVLKIQQKALTWTQAGPKAETRSSAWGGTE